jgi:hypothetical protein|tara:strand:+ start:2878 stop:3012 length:135 start_codon:yes stop_codon:yes gene_type:complete
MKMLMHPATTGLIGLLNIIVAVNPIMYLSGALLIIIATIDWFDK